MDYFLDKDNGLDVLESFRKISGCDCPALLLTGHEFSDSAALCKKYRLLDIIHKPFDLVRLSEYFKNLRIS
jgi:DNA-binding NtrC family response regulator